MTRCNQWCSVFFKLDSEVLYTMASQCSNLQDLDISGLLIVEDSLLFCLAENCPRLSHVNLKGCRKVNFKVKVNSHNSVIMLFLESPVS